MLDMEDLQMSWDHDCIENALKAQWQPFVELQKRMDSYIPPDKSVFEPRRTSLFDMFKAMNPMASDEALAKIVDDQIALLVDHDFSRTFGDVFMGQLVVVTILSQALCEASINAILAIGLAGKGAPELFHVLEKSDFKYKWIYGPKCLDSKYSFPLGDSLGESITHLTKRRNSLIHNKVGVRVKSKLVLEGSTLTRLPLNEQIQWMKRYFSLPYDLCDQARVQLPVGIYSMILRDRGPIPIAEEHRKCIEFLKSRMAKLV